MLNNITGVNARRDEIIKLGKKGKTSLVEVGQAWGCSAKNILSYLHRLQEKKHYAYIVDGSGYFRIFKDF